MRCCVPGCGQQSQKGISFHKFPRKEPERVLEWIDAIVKFLEDSCYTKKCFTPKASYVICSKHFSSNDYIPVQDGRPMLRISASPSIFLCDPNAKRQMKSKECGTTTHVVAGTLRKIAPKPLIKNEEENSSAQSLFTEISETNSNSNELAVPSIGTEKIDSHESDRLCKTQTLRAPIIKVKTQFPQNTYELNSDCSTTPMGLDVSVKTEFFNDVSKNCATCSSLRREIEILGAENTALRKSVATLKEERGEVETLSYPIGDAYNMFSSIPASCRVLDNPIASDDQNSVPCLQRAVKLDHRYESTPRTLKRKLQSSETQKRSIAKKAQITTQKLKRTELKVAEMKQMMKALVETVDLRPEVVTHIRQMKGRKRKSTSKVTLR